MPTINFPTAPATGQEYSFNNKTWKYNGTGWALTNGKPYGREVLTAARTYYVTTAGSDSNDGLTVGTSFLTIQAAIDIVASLDRSIYQVTISVGDGTYTGALTGKLGVGSLPVTIEGNTTTPNNVFLNVTGGVFTATGAGNNWKIKGAKIQGTSTGLSSRDGAIIYHADMIFNSCGTSPLYASGGNIIAEGNYSVAGNSSYIMIALYNSYITAGFYTCTLGANITVTAFASCLRGGIINIESMVITLGAFAVTGKRYSADALGLIYGRGSNVNFLPGTVAGTTATGGQYA